METGEDTGVEESMGGGWREGRQGRGVGRGEKRKGVWREGERKRERERKGGEMKDR